ncbi:MAG TPA: PilN domain-containing protein [Halomicronema sp.]
MYSLDINFLNDRAPLGDPKTKRKGIVVADKSALIAGGAVGALLPLLVAGFAAWVHFNNQNLTQKLTELEQKGAVLSSKKQEVDTIKAQTQQIEIETQALGKVFNTTIKPVAAVLQDIRDRVPDNLQISKIEQSITFDTAAAAAPAAAPAPAPAPPPAPGAGAPPAAPPAPVAPPTPRWEMFSQKIKIQGTAKSFEQVNDFLLTLKNSPFFNSKQVNIVSADLKDNNLKDKVVLPPNKNKQAAANDLQPPTPPQIELPKIVEYTIEAEVSNVPAVEVVRELDRKGAVGLATRIEILQNKGILPQ